MASYCQRWHESSRERHFLEVHESVEPPSLCLGPAGDVFVVINLTQQEVEARR